MKNLSAIIDLIHQRFEIQTRVRDQALLQSRQLTRHAAQAIRAIHRDEDDLAMDHLAKAKTLVDKLKEALSEFPDLYHAGYTQDAIKEFVEAKITRALILNEPLPTADEMGTEYATYLNGMAEVPGELRRRCLDILRQGYSEEAERLLSCMDEIYSVLVTMDYPNVITHGLRRQTDLVRGILERTRADLTMSLREEQLKQSMEELNFHLSSRQEENEAD
ncbi:MAG: haloacid dehalogenase [Anaerolineaceae bacterium]|jgi:translin|nr:haloacid dehalogenase [Anaerolineaceae bacterium]